MSNSINDFTPSNIPSSPPGPISPAKKLRMDRKAYFAGKLGPKTDQQEGGSSQPGNSQTEETSPSQTAIHNPMGSSMSQRKLNPSEKRRKTSKNS